MRRLQMKLLIPLLVISLLVACDKQPPKQDQILTFDVITGQKCTAETPTNETCPAGDVVALIELNGKGEPVKVDTIRSCPGKKVTWKYLDDVAGDAPPFLVIFDPAIYPGNSYKVLSSPKPNANDAQNQEFTLNTRSLKIEEGECLNYAILIPGKALLDPVFIIEK
jgi:hypothetical protein